MSLTLIMGIAMLIAGTGMAPDTAQAQQSAEDGTCMPDMADDEIYQAPLSWAEKAYPKLAYYKVHDTGGHFAAWEQPVLFVEDVRAGSRSLR